MRQKLPSKLSLCLSISVSKERFIALIGGVLVSVATSPLLLEPLQFNNTAEFSVDVTITTTVYETAIHCMNQLYMGDLQASSSFPFAVSWMFYVFCFYYI